MDQVTRPIVSFVMLFIFGLAWFPARLVSNKNNCWFWSFEQRIRHGGHLKFYPSKTWHGYHITWVDDHGTEWEYRLTALDDPSWRSPWWYIPLFFDGRVQKKVSKSKT